MQTKHLVIGNSAGGVGAAEAIRETDKEGALTIVSEEPYPAYSRPLIAKYLSKERTLEEMLFRPSDFYDQNNIVFLPGKKVTHLELDGQTALLDDGGQITWEKLLLAVGGKPIFPRIEGSDKTGVFTFTNLDDAKEIDRYLGNRKTAVVIGGGLIGISATEALAKRGLDVAVVEMKERILNTILDEKASSMAEEVLEQAGVTIVTDHTVVEVNGRESVEGVTLDNGEALRCDLLLVAIGVLPRCELALDVKLEVDRGIVVDHHMATNHTDVYACGDAAEAYDFVHKTNRLIPVWPNAVAGGRVAGFNMAGRRISYEGSTGMNSLNCFGLSTVAAGLVDSKDDPTCEVLADSSAGNGTYRKIVLKNNRIVGMVFVGDIERSGIVFGLMKDRVNVRRCKEALLSPDFGLGALPDDLRRKRLSLADSQRGGASGNGR